MRLYVATSGAPVENLPVAARCVVFQARRMPVAALLTLKQLPVDTTGRRSSLDQRSVTRQRYVPVLIAVLLASACSVPKTTPPPVDSALVHQSVPDEASQLRLTEMCAAGARQFWKEGGYEDGKRVPDQVWGYFTHYNHRLRRCLIQTRLTTLGKGISTHDFVNDAFEGIDVANASNLDLDDARVIGDDVLNGTSKQVSHTSEWFRRLMLE